MAEHALKDADISRGCRQNNPNAWHQLVKRYTPLVYRLALRMLRTQPAAEDATQEVFMLVHGAITRHDPTRPLAPWLAKITYNQCLKRLAKIKRRADVEVEIDENAILVESDEMSPETSVSHRQMAQRIDDALDRLCAQDRAMIIMRYREGFSDSEIAQCTGMPVGTVKTRLHRARNKLKKFLAPFFKEDEI
jgi:RNA polymerase sigma-70 factor (ECF subfamily)